MFVTEPGLDVILARMREEYVHGAAPTQANRLRRDVDFLEDGEGIAQAESDSFHDRPDYMVSRMGCGQANQDPTGRGIEVRSALAHKIRSPK